ncbi:hypothetical protein Tco_0774219 [Tanacetum coccineum]|uniref:Retrotransposon protein n=1 Tax=Tanacetum coccineum TaxID=301880 RepID=A0ABQ4ZS55_9ASTR
MENSKHRAIPMQEKLKLSTSQGASTPIEIQCMQNIPYVTNPRELHWTTVKNILKYLRNTKDMFLIYEDDMKQELKVSCYTNAGYLTDVDDLKSQTRYVFVLNGGVVDWKSTKQKVDVDGGLDRNYKSCDLVIMRSVITNRRGLDRLRIRGLRIEGGRIVFHNLRWFILFVDAFFDGAIGHMEKEE